MPDVQRHLLQLPQRHHRTGKTYPITSPSGNTCDDCHTTTAWLPLPYSITPP